MVRAQVLAMGRGRSSALYLLLVAASAEHTDWTQTQMSDPQIHNLPKMIAEILQTHQLRSAAISTVSETIPNHKLVVTTPPKKLSFKVSLSL